MTADRPRKGEVYCRVSSCFVSVAVRLGYCASHPVTEWWIRLRLWNIRWGTTQACGTLHMCSLRNITHVFPAEQYTCVPCWTIHVCSLLNNTRAFPAEQYTCVPCWTIHSRSLLNNTRVFPAEHSCHKILSMRLYIRILHISVATSPTSNICS